MKTDECADPEGIIGGFFNGLVSGSSGDCKNIKRSAAFGKHPGDGVIMTGIAVKNERNSFC